MFLKANKEDENVDYDAYKEDIAVVNFYFDSPTCFEFFMDSSSSLYDFISQIGGFLGLCIGFSLVSAVEIVYWFTVRLFRGSK